MKLGVIGLGYVGLPLSLVFAESGINVQGFDKDEQKTKELNRGNSYIRHIPNKRVQSVVGSKKFSATHDFSKLSTVDAILICVPTPLNQNREPDLSFVIQTGNVIGKYIAKGSLVVLESTTYPGTTEGELKSAIESESNLIAGEDFHLAYSPEREDPGNPNSKVKIIPKVVGGYTKKCLEKVVDLYSIAIDTVIPVRDCKTAEATKLTENIFRSVNIALVNELKVVYSAMGIDIWDVIEAAKTKPFGFMPFYPGPGLGGHCIPIDPFYLTWKAREFGKHTRFIELAGEINTFMPEYVISKVADVLNMYKKSVNGSRILILGLAYKPNVDDDRESPSYLLMERLKVFGASVDYNDPFVPVIRPSRIYAHFSGIESSKIRDDYDLILLSTNHDEYLSYDFSNFETPIVDTRNCIRNKPKNYFKA